MVSLAAGIPIKVTVIFSYLYNLLFRSLFGAKRREKKQTGHRNADYLRPSEILSWSNDNFVATSSKPIILTCSIAEVSNVAKENTVKANSELDYIPSMDLNRCPVNIYFLTKYTTRLS